MLNLTRFSSSQKRREIANEFSIKIQEIIRSQMFKENELITCKHKLRLSQACVLLWRDWFTGDVDGLWTNSSLLAATYSCILMELIALRKFSCRIEDAVGKASIKVENTEVTNSYLDESASCHVLKLNKTGLEISLQACLLRSMKWKFCTRRNCASVTLDSLQDVKILKRAGECFGLNRLYRTVDLEPYASLEKEIRMIVLKCKPPDCYMKILLTFVSIADSYVPKRDRILKRFFTKYEYYDAKARITSLVSDWGFEKKS